MGQVGAGGQSPRRASGHGGASPDRPRGRRRGRRSGGPGEPRPNVRADRCSSRRRSVPATTIAWPRRGRSRWYVSPSASTRSTSTGKRITSTRRVWPPSDVHRSPPHKHADRPATTRSAAAASVSTSTTSGGGRRPRPSPGRGGSSWTGRAAGPHHAVGHHAAERPLGRLPRPIRVSPCGATTATWRARSTSCFIVRTKSPPVSSSSPTTWARPSPATQAWARPRSRDRGGGARRGPASVRRPPGPSWWRRSDPTDHGRRSTGTTADRRLRAAVLVHEHRQQPGERGRVQAVEHAAVDALGDEQVGLVEQPRQRLPSLGQRPRRGIHVAPPVEHVEHVVELAGQRLAMAVDPAGQIGQLPLESLGLAGGPHPLAQLGVGLDGVGAIRDAVALAGLVAPQLGARQRPRHLAAVLGAVGAEDGRQAHGADRRGTSLKSSADSSGGRPARSPWSGASRPCGGRWRRPPPGRGTPLGRVHDLAGAQPRHADRHQVVTAPPPEAELVERSAVLPDVAERALGHGTAAPSCERTRSRRASRRTTSRSDWYSANDRLSRWWA